MTEYTANTSNATNTITATAADEGAVLSIEVNGDPHINGSSVTWDVGENTIIITVINHLASDVYTVVVTKT